MTKREELTARIRELRKELEDADKDSRRYILEQICILLTRLAAT